MLKPRWSPNCVIFTSGENHCYYHSLYNRPSKISPTDTLCNLTYFTCKSQEDMDLESFGKKKKKKKRAGIDLADEEADKDAGMTSFVAQHLILIQ